MKILASLSLLAAGALAFAPATARAGNDGLAAVGGFIGGLIVGTSLDHGHRSGHGHDYHHHAHPGGYWKEISVRTWVPGYWTYEGHRHGHRHGHGRRYYVEGCYAYRTERVWVSEDYRHDDDDRHDRSYGYNRRR